jgi:hypothetical protein
VHNYENTLIGKKEALFFCCSGDKLFNKMISATRGVKG